MWMIAEDGMGKSTLAATIALKFRQQNRLLGAYFFRADNCKQSDPAAMVLALAYQVALCQSDSRGSMLQGLEKLQNVDGRAGEQLDLLLLTPLLLSSQPDEGFCLFVIDGIDEVTGVELKELTRAVASLASIAPWIKVFVTSRPHEELKAAISPLQPLIVQVDDYRYREDLRELATRLVTDRVAEEEQVPMAINKLIEKSGGSLLYCGLVEFILKTSVQWSLSELQKELPDGVSECFMGYFVGLKDSLSKAGKDFDKSVRPLLSLLVVMREHLSTKEAQVLLNASEEEVDELAVRLAAIFPLVLEGRERRFKCRHKAVLDWLRDAKQSGEFVIDVTQAQNSFAAGLLKQLNGWNNPKSTAWTFPPPGSYIYYNLLAHMDEAGRTAEANSLLVRLPWMMKTVEERGGVSLIIDIKRRLLTGDEDRDRSVLYLVQAIRLSLQYLQVEEEPQPERLPLQLIGRLKQLVEAKINPSSSPSPSKASSSTRAVAVGSGSSPEVPGEGRKSMLGSLGRIFSFGRRSSAAANGGSSSSMFSSFGSSSSSSSRAMGPAVYKAVYEESCEWWKREKSYYPLRLPLSSPGGYLQSTFALSAPVQCIVLVQKGLFACGCNDAKIYVCDDSDGVAAGERDKVLEGHTQDVTALTVMADGRLVSASADKSLRVWDVRTGQCLKVLIGHTESVYGVAALDKDLVASCSGDKSVRIWDAYTGKIVKELREHSDTVYSVAALSGGRLVSASKDKTIKIWNVSSGKCIRALTGHTEMVRSVAAFPDGRIVSGSDDKTVRIWNSVSGECTKLLGHTRGVLTVTVLDDSRIASGSYDKSVRVWDPVSAQCVKSHDGHVDDIRCVSSMPGGRILSCSLDRTVCVWNGYSFIDTTKGGHTERVISVVVLPDGRVASASSDGTIGLWDAATGECTKKLTGHSWAVTSIVCLPDGKLVSGSIDKNLKVWDSVTGECLKTLTGHTKDVRSLAVMQDGKVVSASYDKSLRIWDIATGQCVKVLNGHNERIVAVNVLDDGSIISGSMDKNIRMWDPVMGDCLGFRDGDPSEALPAVRYGVSVISKFGGLPPFSCSAVGKDGRVAVGTETGEVIIFLNNDKEK